MASEARLEIDVHLDDGGVLAHMGAEIRQGLSSCPKWLPSKYLYDEQGSLLFERITELPEYYLTRTEQRLLDRWSPRIAREADPSELVELGAGSATKTRTLIEAGRAHANLGRYLMLEVSREIAEQAAQSIAESYPDLQVHAVVGDFEGHLDEIPPGGRRLVAFLGSTIGNFEEPAAAEFLRGIGDLFHEGGSLLLGTDLVKDRGALEAAYNDSAGVTARFNLNILNVINQRLDADFDLDGFEHVSFFNPERSRIESYLRSTRDQKVHLEGIDLEVGFAAGESMRTEVSCKYTRRSVETLVERAGYRLEHWFEDPERPYALSLSTPLAD